MPLVSGVGGVGDRNSDMNESGRKVAYSPLRTSGRNEVESIGLERGGQVMLLLPHCRETRFLISPAVSLSGLVSLLSTVFVVVSCLHWSEMLLSQNQAQEPRSPAVLAFWDLRMGLRLVLWVACSNSRWLVGASSSAVGRGMCCWRKHSLYIGAAGASGVGRLCSVGRPCQPASYWGGWVELWLRLLKRCSVPLSPSLLG